MKKKIFVLALDDSGTRHPDHKLCSLPAHGHDWFGIGGVVFDEDDEEQIREAHGSFCERWNLKVPLHSSEIRSRKKGFSFLGNLEKYENDRFFSELTDMLLGIPVLGHACVIDRPGYNARYEEQYREQRWSLCKSAFSIVTERSAKYAISKDAKLRVYIERSDKNTDKRVKSYYDEMRSEGMPFSSSTSKLYNPATSEILSRTLYDFKAKQKSSPLMQIADMYLWPICMSGYDSECRPYTAMKQAGRLIDCALGEGMENFRVKYYCFDSKKPG